MVRKVAVPSVSALTNRVSCEQVHPLPPKVHQGSQARTLCADLVSGLLFDREPLRFDEHFDGVDLGVSLAFDFF